MMENSQLETATRRSRNKANRPATAATRRVGFTLIEILIALSIFAIMMSIIFVPLNLALKLFHISKTRSDLLSATQTTMDTMERELRKAIYVFPNEALPGVTDLAPYTAGGANPSGHPYVSVTGSGIGVCDANTPSAQYADNPSRIDFLLADNYYIDPVTKAGTELLQPLSPLQPAPYLVSYYPRRLDASNTAIPAEPFDNPIVLFRALIPYREHNGTRVVDPMAGMSLNANLSSTGNSRYPTPGAGSQCVGGSAATATNRGSYWLDQFRGTNEPNLEPLCFETTTNAIPPQPPYAPIPGSHTLMLPRGVTLEAPQAYDPIPPATPDYTPTTTFHCADTNNDHKIDQVTITLALSSYDDIGADRRGGQFNAQRQSLTHVISLPNVK